jgi:tetratricopeptide (TPR) repeat protein
MVALTPHAIWIQDVWQTCSISLEDLGPDRGRNGKELALSHGPAGARESHVLAFDDAAAADRWLREIRRQQEMSSGAPPLSRYQPEGVSLVRRAAKVPHQVLGQVEFTSHNSWAADRGLQLKAGMRGADVVINVERHRCPDLGWGACQAAGTLIRVEDADARKRMRLRSYADQVRALVTSMFWLLLVQGVLLYLGAVFCTGPTSLQVPTGQKVSEALTSGGLGFVIVFVWPFVMLMLLGSLRWPGLLRPTGLAVLAATTGRSVTVLLAHLLAVKITGAALGGVGILLDPFNWAIIIIGVRLFARSRSVARDARQILPDDMQVSPTPRTWCTRGLGTASALYGLALLGFVGITRFEDSRYLLQPGIDVRREQQALLAMNEGLDQFDRGDLAAAELSWKKSLELWEQMTRAPSAPAVYRVNMAQTLYNLALVCDRQNRPEDADKYYERVVALAPQLEADPNLLNPHLKQILADARRMPLERRRHEAMRVMDEGLDQINRGDLAAAERSWKKSLKLYEELTKAPSAPVDCRPDMAQTLFNLGIVCERLNRPDEAVEYYLRVVNLAPQLEAAPQGMTPQLRQTLKDARRAVAELRR